MSWERPRHTNLDEIIRQEASLPGVSNVVKMIKNVFSEFEGNNWAKSACGNVSSQALSACLAESQFRGCVAQQTLSFWATVLLGGHLFESTGSAANAAATDPVVVWFGRDEKSALHFSNRANTTFAH